MATPSDSTDMTRADTGTVAAAISDLPPVTEFASSADLARERRRKTAITLVILVGALGLAGGWFAIRGDASSSATRIIYYTVQPRDLEIAVTERGTLESQSNVQVRCEVDDVQGDGIYGTTILWLVENGAEVEEGDLVVELDLAPHRERIDEQILEAVYARGQFIARTLDYQNREIQNETVKADAELRVALAKLDLQQYEDEEGGTYQMELQSIEQSIQQRDAQMLIADQNFQGTKRLFELGYKSKGDLAQAELGALWAQSSRDEAVAQRLELEKYTYRREKLQRQGEVDSAVRNLIQVERNNAAALAQSRVWLKMAETGKVWHEARLAEYEEQLTKCKIYAPQSGMVAYHVDASRWGQSETIAVGVAVRYRQTILSIPDMKHMQIRTSVHESVVESVALDMPAIIRLDAFPEVVYQGHVKTMDVLPDPGGWMASDTKVYNTVVTIDEEVAGIKPGMTAVVEIFIETLPDVLCIPNQSIVRRGEDDWCYVNEDGRIVRRQLELGKTNDRFIEVRSGLEAGEKVVLNATAILSDAPDDGRKIGPDSKIEPSEDAGAS